MLRQVPVVSQEKQTFGLRIQPTNVEKAIELCREQVEDRIARMRIAAGGNESGGFMKEDGGRRLYVDELAVHLHVIPGSGLSTEIGTNLAVDGHAARDNQVIALPARSQTGRSEIPVEAHGECKTLKR